ncbi:MAG: hypothetical protein ABIT36_02200 [Steroidobacteraceae bacterium]
MDPTNEVVIVPWYREDNYAEVLAVMDDAASLPDCYEWWHRGAAETVARLNTRGARLATVSIDAAMFLVWCSENDLLPNAEARMEYAAELASGDSSDQTRTDA